MKCKRHRVKQHKYNILRIGQYCVSDLSGHQSPRAGADEQQCGRRGPTLTGDSWQQTQLSLWRTVWKVGLDSLNRLHEDRVCVCAGSVLENMSQTAGSTKPVADLYSQ